MTSREFIYARRLALATLFAGAATLSASAFGPATVCAAPQEWDVGAYDSCVAVWLGVYQSDDDFTFQDYHEAVKDCCLNSGGVLSETQGCVAPVGEQAQEAEREPPTPPPPPPGAVVGPPANAAERPPAPPPGTVATLWMPPPPPPMVLYPGAITPGPASRG